ncbi:MAG: serine/threonine-protein kinase RsbW [Solirubrobacterales bacterium]|jgi:anti-sigma regulatory factor (Ser/Thr protein kinase)|nr:serine/threonine-protein kinase RsbW [Solirubrobacterales bacterium]
MSEKTAPAIQMTVLSSPENIAVVRHGLAGLAEGLGAAPDLVDDIKTAVSEAVTNAVVHGYPGSVGPIDVEASVTERRLEIVVRDQGAGIQPRPLSDEQTSLRVGLALIGALSDEFVVRGEDGGGTELRISFDLDRGERGEVEQQEHLSAQSMPGENEARIAIRRAAASGAAIPKVLEMFVARADLSIERLSDAHVIGDFLSNWTSQAVDSKPLNVAITDGEGKVEIRIGPLEPGVGTRMLESNALPGLGNTLERITDRAEITRTDTDAGPAEYLVLELRSD